MIHFIYSYFGLYHLIISSILFSLLVFINTKKQSFDLEKMILILCSIDLVTYNFYILTYHNSNLIDLLPIHLCYLTEIMIFIKLLFSIRLDTNFMFLNSAVGSIAGLINNNLTNDMHCMFFLHHYMAHFILGVFVIEYYNKISLNLKILTISVFKTTLLFIFALIFNNLFGTNYWFINEKPAGNKLTLLFPESPWYLIIMITLGLLIYLALFIKFKINYNNQKNNEI